MLPAESDQVARTSERLTRAALAIALLISGCSIDRRPTPGGDPDRSDASIVDLVGKSGPPTAPDAAADADANQAGSAGGGPSSTDEPPENDPEPEEPTVGVIDAGSAEPELDSGTPDGGADAASQPPPSDAGPPPIDAGSPGVIDAIWDVLSSNPRVAEAAALRRILAALSTSGSGQPAVADALDALGQVDCLRNARVCIAVCGWAVLNCDACAGDATCTAAMSQNCGRSCP